MKKAIYCKIYSRKNYLGLKDCRKLYANFYRDFKNKFNFHVIGDLEKNEIDLVQKIVKIEISKVDYDDLYTKYLEENNIKHNTAVKKIFNTMNRSKYEIIEVEEPNLERAKVYTIEDIEPSLLLSKTGKKLSGSILANRIQKILAEMNEGNFLFQKSRLL